jgi:very-short-patch-repair endonuclease
MPSGVYKRTEYHKKALRVPHNGFAGKYPRTEKMRTGKYPRTEETRKRMSVAAKIRAKVSPMSEDGKRRLSMAVKKRYQAGDKRGFFQNGNKCGQNVTRKGMYGENNPWFGKKPPNWKNLYTQEINEKRRQARLKQKLPSIDTSIERKTKEWLESKKINYIHPFNLGNRFQCDFYIPTLNLIIECDGTYWHSLPKAIERDERKDAYAKKYGFNIIRLLEEDISKGRFFQLEKKIKK